MSKRPLPARRLLNGLAMALLLCGCRAPAASTTPAAGPGPAAAGPGALRFTGTVEAVRTRSVVVPRLAGASTAMIITRLAKSGTRVKEGDILVEFDRQEQQRIAFDRKAELVDLDSQIDKKRADLAAAEAKDRTGLVSAENDVTRAKLAVSTNDLIARVSAEKNTLTLQQNIAKLEQLKLTFDLRREAAAADLKILQIRRERAERALRYAESNASLMAVASPFSGLVVVKTTWKPGATGMTEIIEGDEVRPGQALINVVDTSAMQVRGKINQADMQGVRVGMPVTVRLDGFPDLAFKGRLERVTPLATTSGMSALVRTFVAVVSIEGKDAQLLPDLTASVELIPAPAAAPPAAAKGGR
jgi:HlyD family secretion protein